MNQSKKVKRNTKQTQTSSKKSDYPVNELSWAKALNRAEYLLECAMLPVTLWGETAERIYNKKSIEGLETIEFAVKKSSLSKYSLSTLNTMEPDWRSFVFEGIPIKIHIIAKDRGLLKHPDRANFWGGNYFVPNPFEKYWKMRGLVK